MGLRHRSIRLRVGVLIAVPVLCLLALYGFVASITAGNVVSQQRARALRNDIVSPVTGFEIQLAQERHFALLSLANPTNTGMAAALGRQQGQTQRALAALTLALQSPAVTSYAAKPEHRAIENLITASHSLTGIRGDVADDAISMRAALSAYDAIIDAGYLVIDEALNQQTDVSFVTQGLDVIDLGRAAQATQEEWDLLAADMAQHKFPTPDRLVFATLANQRQTLVSNAVLSFDPSYSGMLAKNLSPVTANAMSSLEAAVISTPWRRGTAPARLIGSRMTFLNYSNALGNGLKEAAAELEAKAQHHANTQVLQLILAAGLGLIGTIVSIALSLVIGRGLVRQLRDLRESALTLAREKLPNVIARLRSGDQVDVSEYVPADTSSANEIDQVQHAFSLVQQSAVQSAVDEARLRRGISDVFRNLAGRSQSLLHRQLTLLDGMERRATEPDELEDLFRIDHLTTRMRRHAEGLIILSGEAPARGWRQPVPLVDVLRAAVAEVEDYTRIRVLCRTNAAVAGHAVADLIHLIAELAENATVFSPPNTPVRIQGDVVGRGFVVEIEDRGLGISAARLEEINANLANPPQFDLSGSDRLGLFIAGQLAQRHDVKITLRPSVYGGTTAIVLIPTALAVDDDAAGRDPALADGDSDLALADGLPGRHAALSQPAGRSAPALTSGSPGSTGDARDPLAAITVGSDPVGGNPVGSDPARSNGHLAAQLAAERIAAERLAAEQLGAEQLAGGRPSAGRPSAADMAAADLTASGVAGNTPGPRRFTRPDSDPDAAGYIARGYSLGGRTAPSADLPARTSREPGERAPSTSERADSRANAAEVTELGLPVRVRQASLAPQLRNTPPAAGAQSATGGGFTLPGRVVPEAGGPSGSGFMGTGTSGTGPSPVPAAPADRRATAGPIPATPEAARNVMSALQRGWQLGRSEAEAADQPPISVFTPRKSPTGQAVAPYDLAAGSAEADPADGADEHGGE